MNDLAIRTVDELARIAAMFAKSELAGKDTPADIGVKVMAGRELGMGPVASIQGVIMVKGRPTLKAQTWAALIKKHPRYDYRVRTHDKTQCVIEFFENGEPIGMSAFTIDDAKQAGLAGGDNWRKYPEAMLFARAITKGGRTYCPDVSVGGIYTPDEVDEVDEAYEAEPIEVTVNDEPTPPSGGDGGGQEATSGTDAAPPPEEVYADDDTFKQTVAGLVAAAALPDGYMARVCENEGVAKLLELSPAKRAALVEELKEMR